MESYNYRNLIFEGGGVKGIAYGGALEVLDKKGILPNIQRVAGTSAGAINATLLALGYTSTEVSKIVADTDFASFADHGNFFGNAFRILRHFGWNKGDTFKDFLVRKIGIKTGSEKFTFADLDQKVKAATPGFRHLYVVATNLSAQRPEIFSHEHTPDVVIADAVRMSMSIPLYFKSVTWKDSVMVDGGVSYNYPVNLFDNKKYLSNPANGIEREYDSTPGFVFNYETLGFRLDSKDLIELSRKGWLLPPAKVGNIKQFSLSLIDFMMEMANRAHLHANDWGRTIFIDTLDVQTTDFDRVKTRVNVLTESGRDAVTKYFDWKDNDPVWQVKPS